MSDDKSNTNNKKIKAEGRENLTYQGELLSSPAGGSTFMFRGYIKLWRKRKEWAFSNNPFAVALWEFLLLEANHKTTRKMFKGNVIDILPGQLISGRKYIAAETGISETTVERLLDLFESEQQIIQQKSSKNRLITLKNWELYQGQDPFMDNRWTTDGQQMDNRWTTNGQQMDTPKNGKNDNNVKNGKNDKNNNITGNSKFWSYDQKKRGHMENENENINEDNNINVNKKKERVQREEETIPYNEIIDDLNMVIGAKYKYTAKNKELIKARYNDGFTIEDFRIVHRKMSKSWGIDQKMAQYLRPITLYSNKFESYLNKIEENTMLTEQGHKNLEAGRNFLEKIRGIENDGQRETC